MLAVIIGGVVLVFLTIEFFGGGVQTSGNDFTTALANAIATAENSPASSNNPGSLGAGDVASENIVGRLNSAGVVLIDTIENGWTALRNKLDNILSGNSNVYSPDMTISQFAQVYTGGDNADGWASTVANKLGVTTDTTLEDAEAQFNGQ